MLRAALTLPAVADIDGTPGVLLAGAGEVQAEGGMLPLQRVGDRHTVESGVELARAILAVAHTLQ